MGGNRGPSVLVEARPLGAGARDVLSPVKLVLKKLMRWYVEPALMDQRTFNAAVLRLVDELQQQAAANTRKLEERLARLEEGDKGDSAER